MTKKTLSINFPIERSVLSDFSPFEVPIIFSNRHFYKFLVKYQLKQASDGVNFSWKSSDDSVSKTILILLGLSQDTEIKDSQELGVGYKITKIEENKLPTIPFSFPISHKHNEFRYLSLIHPKGQVLAVDFYRNFKDIITYYSNVSPLSLRSAKRVAGCTYIDSKSLLESYDKDDLRIELEGDVYENIRSFFVYKKYRNIFEFYESVDHHWCEKRFNYLSKLDVSQCFDSVYTHSIAWAVFSKEYAKKNLSKTKKTFPSKFDKLMQRVNYNETNGILIGPELSRIFAEIILQAIDFDIIYDLNNSNLLLGKDYQIYRYVDDYFIFYNDSSVFDRIRSSISINLKFYKFSLNKSKEETYSRPIITPITVAKKKIANLISDKLKYNIEKTTEDDVDFLKGHIYINKSSFSTDFKSILADCGVTYSDIMNYTLSIIEKKVSKILADYHDIGKTDNKSPQLVNALVSIIKLSFFIYSVSPRVNSTIKICRIMQKVIIFAKSPEVCVEDQHIIFKCIFDNSCSILEKNSISDTTPIETLYLLVLIRQLGKYYWLDELVLIKYLNVCKVNGLYLFKGDLDYFSIISILFYISNKKRYCPLKESLVKGIRIKYKGSSGDLLSSSEFTHLTLDLITCPYIDNSFKAEIIEFYGVDKSYLKRISLLSCSWFTKWSDFNFAKELDAKLSNDVY